MLRTRYPALFRLFREFRFYRAGVALVLVLGFVISAIQPVAVKMSQAIIDSFQAGKGLGSIGRLPLFVVLLFAASGLAKFFHNTKRKFISERIILKLRASLFEKYVQLPLAELDRRRTGEMLSTLQNDLQQIGGGIETICDLLKEPVTFIGLVALAFYCDWRLALSTIVVAPLVVQLFSRSGAAVKRYSTNNLKQFADLVSLSQESVTGSRVVKVFRLESTLVQKFHTIQEGYFRMLWKSIRVQELGTPSVEFIGALLMAGVILYGGYRIEAGELTVGNLVAFVLALGLAQMPIKQLNNVWLRLRIAEAAAERVYGILDMPDSIRERSGTIRLERLRESIRFENVSLHYGDKPALKDVSLTVEKGQVVGLVGASGSGKSSLVNLLPRLYDPTRGRVTMDGIDVRDLDLDSLRSLISVVSQDTFLFNDTVYENIRYGRADATRQEIESAAEKAHCLDFVRRLPEGFDTRVGDRGVSLSGGERQRLAIARALLKGAPILILDEATSSLDSHSELVVQRALDELMKDKTTLLVAHRFATVLRADRIVVMESGRVLDTGTHEELVGKAGTYRELFDKQVLPARARPEMTV